MKPVLLLFLVFCVGCVGPQLDQDFIALTEKVFDRHDSYITEDTALIALEKEAYLEESAACREYLHVVQDQTKEGVKNYP